MEGPLIPVITTSLFTTRKGFYNDIKPDMAELIGSSWVIFLTPEQALKYRDILKDVIVEKDSFMFLEPEKVLTWKRPFL